MNIYAVLSFNIRKDQWNREEKIILTPVFWKQCDNKNLVQAKQME